MIKDLIVNLSAGNANDISGDYAVSVAAAFDAHLTAVAFSYQPPITGTMFDGVATSVIDTYRAQTRKAAESTRSRFEESARRAGVRIDTRIVDCTVAEAANTFARMARRHDLSVVSQPRPDDGLPEDLIVESTLFESGRPLLIVPYIQKDGLKLDRVLACWDGSRNAARAIADALPMLKRAAAVEVITVETKERRGEFAGADIAEHLARHDVKVELKSFVTADMEVADVILSHAADSSADLIVMGGYGHSRLREFVLGGATRGMLSSMTVPTLMAH